MVQLLQGASRGPEAEGQTAVFPVSAIAGTSLVGRSLGNCVHRLGFKKLVPEREVLPSQTSSSFAPCVPQRNSRLQRAGRAPAIAAGSGPPLMGGAQEHCLRWCLRSLSRLGWGSAIGTPSALLSTRVLQTDQLAVSLET